MNRHGGARAGGAAHEHRFNIITPSISSCLGDVHSGFLRLFFFKLDGQLTHENKSMHFPVTSLLSLPWGLSVPKLIAH